MPVCSNCGGSDFVWAENLRTGTIGRGTLSLRSGGELALGTRVCRGCGHADLFVKDPTILRQPHTWRPGEFVPIPPRPPPEPRPTTSIPPPVAPTAPPASPGTPGPAGPETTVPPKASLAAGSQSLPTPPPPPTSAEISTAPAPDAAPATGAKPAKGGKRPARRKGAKAKPPSPTILQE